MISSLVRVGQGSVPMVDYSVASAPVTPPHCDASHLICLLDSHPGVAGYLQAAGAIIMIGVVHWQGLADRRRRRAEAQAFVALCKAAMRDVNEELQPFLNWAQAEGNWEARFVNLEWFYESPANDTLVRLLEMPLSQWPSLDIYKAMRAVQHCVSRMRVDIDATIVGNGDLGPNGTMQIEAKAFVAALANFNETVRKFN